MTLRTDNAISDETREALVETIRQLLPAAGEPMLLFVSGTFGQETQQLQGTTLMTQRTQLLIHAERMEKSARILRQLAEDSAIESEGAGSAQQR